MPRFYNAAKNKMRLKNIYIYKLIEYKFFILFQNNFFKILYIYNLYTFNLKQFKIIEYPGLKHFSEKRIPVFLSLLLF